MGKRLTVTEQIRRSITEKEWQEHVVTIARLNGWLIYHAPDNVPNAKGHVQRITPGFPDLIMVRGDRMVVAELKTATGVVKPAQWEWLGAMEQVPGVETHVWRPGDDQKVIATLRRDR